MTIQVCTIHFWENHFLRQQSFNERYEKHFQNQLFSQQKKSYPIYLSLSLSKFYSYSHRIEKEIFFNHSRIFLYCFHHVKFLLLYLFNRTHLWINRMQSDAYISRRGYHTCGVTIVPSPIQYKGGQNITFGAVPL